ncbi:RICIN domain-containing protein [Candidatus Saccharibacteria bacterium]|nr:RICIN domain-containing protein [Candidatus Saccharibacteria bacterium]
MHSNNIRLSILGAVLSFMAVVFAPAPAEAGAAPFIVRPQRDVISGWSVTPAGTAAWAALDDATVNGQPVGATDWIYASGAGRVTEVGFTSAPIDAPYYWGQVYFYANTGASTRLRVEALTQGSIVATYTVAAGQGFGWRSFSVPASSLDYFGANNLTVRFTSLDGGDTNVRAAYAELTQGYYKIKNVATNNYMDASSGGLVLMRAASTSLSQQYKELPARIGSSGLSARSNGLCVEIPNASTASGTLLSQGTCLSDVQLYNFDPIGAGKRRIYVRHSGLCLSTLAFDSFVRQYPCNSSSINQQWLMERYPL